MQAGQQMATFRERDRPLAYPTGERGRELDLGETRDARPCLPHALSDLVARRLLDLALDECACVQKEHQSRSSRSSTMASESCGPSIRKGASSSRGSKGRLDRSMSPRAAECMTNPHTADLSGLAALWDMKHIRIARPDDLDDFEPGTKPVLLEITPDAEQTAHFWAAYERLVK